MNTTHQCPLYNTGKHSFCGKLALKPGQEGEKIIEYYICPSCEGTGGGKRMGTEVEEFEEGIIDSIFPIRLMVKKRNKVKENR